VTLQTRAAENFHSCRWGDERTVKRALMLSKDPHRRERIFSRLKSNIPDNLWIIVQSVYESHLVKKDSMNSYSYPGYYVRLFMSELC
jgi:hypothetical protein